MQYFREKYQNVAFVVASDDRQWCKQMFKNMSDVHLTPRYQTMKRGEYDMAILAQCNHSIIRYVENHNIYTVNIYYKTKARYYLAY